MDQQNELSTNNLTMPVVIENKGQKIDLFDVSEVGLVIGAHENTVRTYVHNGTIRANKINGGWYVTRGSLESYLDSLNLPLSVIDHRLKDHSESNLKEERQP